MDKDTVAKLYIFQAYYGWRANGIEQVCFRMGVDLLNIDLPLACAIVARLKYPEPQHPGTKRSHQILRRAEYILESIITEEFCEALVKYERWGLGEVSISVTGDA